MFLLTCQEEYLLTLREPNKNKLFLFGSRRVFNNPYIGCRPGQRPRRRASRPAGQDSYYDLTPKYSTQNAVEWAAGKDAGLEAKPLG